MICSDLILLHSIVLSQILLPALMNDTLYEVIVKTFLQSREEQKRRKHKYMLDWGQCVHLSGHAGDGTRVAGVVGGGGHAA